MLLTIWSLVGWFAATVEEMEEKYKPVEAKFGMLDTKDIKVKTLSS